MGLAKIANERSRDRGLLEDSDNKRAFFTSATSGLPLPLAYQLSGISAGHKEGHKTAGFFLGAPGAMGAEAKDTDRSYLKQVLAGSAVGTAVGTAILRKSLGLNMSPTAIVRSAAEGAIGGGLLYGLGHYFGHKYTPEEKRLYKQN